MAGFEMTGMGPTARRTHSVQCVAMVRNRKWFGRAALAAQTRSTPNVASKSPHRPGHGMFHGPCEKRGGRGGGLGPESLCTKTAQINISGCKLQSPPPPV